MQSMNGVYYANTVKTHWRNMIRKIDWTEIFHETLVSASSQWMAA
jgi:hypothetical protein